MKKIIILMNICMGFCMSLVLSLLGTAMSGHLELITWLISFGISFLISLLIGFLVPIKKLGDAACAKCKIPAQSFKGTLVSALISDLIYTPVITVSMVVIMLKIAAQHAPAGELPPIPLAILRSLPVCLIAGYVLIVLIQPVLIKLLTRKMPGGPGGRPGGPGNNEPGNNGPSEK